MYSDIALKLYAMVIEEQIKSRTQFWNSFCKQEKLVNFNTDTKNYEQFLLKNNINLTCYFDADFPVVDNNFKQSEKPFLFAYKGNISLLQNINKNIAVAGVLTPTEDITKREQSIVSIITKNSLNIISGLADGCDSVAHKTCLSCGGKTIAFLPTTLSHIYPAKNVSLANEIVNKGGLVITEYITEPKSRGERISRFIERDRLQAMFAKAVILIASFEYGKGDSGSRHAMQKAKEYGKKRYVLYYEQTDKDKPLFGLNKQLINENAEILTQKSLQELTTK